MKCNPTTESIFTGKSGITIIIHRYGADDYSAWFTDDPNNDTSGCSVRGTFRQILDELKDEIRKENDHD